MESRIPAWVWLFTGAILGAFIMFLVKLSDMEAPSNSGQQNTDTAETNNDDGSIPITFYEKLKESTSFELPKLPDIANKKPQSDEPTVQYLIQVASFKSDKDAEQLRVELMLLSLTKAHTRRAQLANKDVRFRVVIGPIATRSELEATRKKLLDNQYDALVLKQKP